MRGRDPRPPDDDVRGRGPPLRAAARRRPRARVGRRRTTSASTASSSGRPTTAGRGPSSTRATTSGRCGSSSARAASAIRSRPTSTPPWPDELKALGIDALWTYSKQLQRGEIEWPDARAAPRRPGLRGRGLARRRSSSSSSRRGTDASPASRSPTSRSTRGSTASRGRSPDIRWLLSTVPTRDDLRRPRRPRRLEHLVALGRGDAREAVVGGAHHRRVHGVLDLPAPRQPLAARARRGDDAAARQGRGATPARCCASSRTSGTASRRRAAGRSTATSATRGCSCSTRARRACSPTAAAQMIDDDEWDWIVEHSRGAFDHLVIASTLPVFLPTGIHHLAGVERGALRTAAGARLAANLSERLRRAVDLEHWAAFNRSFEQLCDWLRTVARGTEAARPPASILLLGGDVHRSSVSEVELGSRQPLPRAPARLLAVPQPALAEGAADRRGRPALALGARIFAALGAARRRAARRRRRGVRSGAGPSRTRSASSFSTAAPRPRRSGGARTRARIRSGSSSSISRSSSRRLKRRRTSDEAPRPLRTP